MIQNPDRILLLGRTALPLLAFLACALPLYAQEPGSPQNFDTEALLEAFRRAPDPAPTPKQPDAPKIEAVSPFHAVDVEDGRVLALSEHLDPYRKARFLEERHRISPRLPVLGGDALTYFHLVATVDLAYLYATHGLWAEAGSISKSGSAIHDRLLGASAESDRELGLLRAEMDRIDAAVFLMDPRFLHSRERARPILEGYAKKWPDMPLYQAILEIESGNLEAAGPLLSEAADILDRMPAAWRAQILPILLEGSVASGSEVLTESLMADLTGLSARTPAGILPYLQGLQFERGAKFPEAMDAYAKAAGHDDMFAQRSRLARIRLGLTQKLLDIEQARSELAIARNTWHGDDLALSALRLAIDIERDTGHPLEALLAIEEIRIRYPEAEGIISEKEKWDLVQAFYTPEDGSQRPFADLLSGHRRISELHGSEFGFFKYAESMGDQLRAFGALRLAGEEYARALDAMDVAGEGLWKDPEPRPILAEFYDRLRLKEAETLLEIGEASEARDLLETPLRDSSKSETVDRFVLLRARAAYASGSFELVDDGFQSKPSAEHLRLSALAQAEMKDWGKARETWIDLFDLEGRKPQQTDIDSFALVSERAGMIAKDTARIAALSKAAAHPQPAAFAAILAEPAADISPLTHDVLTSHTDRAGRALEVAKGDQ